MAQAIPSVLLVLLLSTVSKSQPVADNTTEAAGYAKPCLITPALPCPALPCRAHQASKA